VPITHLHDACARCGRLTKPQERPHVPAVPPSDNMNAGADAATSSQGIPRVRLMGLDFAALTEVDVAAYVVRQSAAGQGGWLVTPNLDILRQCSESEQLADLVRSADMRVADGMPLVWGSRLQGTPLPGRVAGSNLVSMIAASGADLGLRLFLLGGNPGAADGAAATLLRRYPGIQVAGTYCPGFGFEHDELELARMERLVRLAKPDIVLVGLGFPKQERLIQRLRPGCPTAWWLGIGITFSFLSGEVSRAPPWMQRCGLEWMHRIAQEPRRLAARYLIHGVPFAARLFTSAVQRRNTTYF
jgi:N-acetylglucosaminyldiphosphoundecaprenol N-acetyl-beta-D-mannosaminyltransferase